MNSASPAERRKRANALPSVPDADATDIATFLDAIWAENGLAKPTLASYRRDLEGFARDLRELLLHPSADNRV